MKDEPLHVAIVMDGNGRWADLHNKTRMEGHKAGTEALRRTIKACVKQHVKYLSVYAFSTENWKRPEKEVSFLMTFFKTLLDRESKELHKEGVKLSVLGDKSKLSSTLKNAIDSTESLTKCNTVLHVNLMINYGGRDEIVRGIKKMIQNHPNLDSQSINPEMVAQHLDTAGIPDPDIFIRTSSEYRLSNFMLWQLAYTEMFFLDILWPDFSENHLKEVIIEYGRRDRRYGGRV